MVLLKEWLDPESTSYVAVVIEQDLGEGDPEKRILELRLELHDGGCNNAVCCSLLPTGMAEDLPRALEQIAVLENAVHWLKKAALAMSAAAVIQGEVAVAEEEPEGSYQ